MEDEPEDCLPEIPSDLDMTETDPVKVKGSFENKWQAKIVNGRTQKKRDQKKRQKLRRLLQQHPQQ
jgi:hypothetical protein